MEELKAKNLDPNETSDEFEMAIDVEETPEWLTGDFIRAKAIQRLAVKQLAIRILVRPAIAHSYQGVLKNYNPDPSYPQIHVPNLLFELGAIQRRIRQIKANPNANVDDLMKHINPRSFRTQREDANRDRTVRRNTYLYLGNNMSLEGYLLHMSDSLLKSQDPDWAFAFTTMITTFTKTRQNDLAALVIRTILPYRFELTSTLILAAINFFRKSKDLKAFDLFLEMLAGKGYPINMGNLSYYKTTRANGLEIVVPPLDSVNIVVYAALIRACLRFDQPQRADAYLLVARASGCTDDASILMAYLEFYAIRKDWSNGRSVLQRTLAFIASTTNQDYDRVPRLILMMTQLCDECGKLEVSEAFIRGAVQHGFSPYLPFRQTDIVSKVDPDCLRWLAAAELSPSHEENSIRRNYFFVVHARDQLDILDPPRVPHARRLWRLMSLYSEQALSNVVESGARREATRKDNHHPEPTANNDELDMDEANPGYPSISSNATPSMQEQGTGALKEHAELKVNHDEPKPDELPTSNPEYLSTAPEISVSAKEHEMDALKGHPELKTSNDEPKPDESHESKPEDPSTSPNTASAQEQEIGALRDEVAQLKQLILRLYQLPAAPSLQQTETAAKRLKILKARYNASA